MCTICGRTHGKKCEIYNSGDITHFYTYDDYYRRSCDKIYYKGKQILFYVRYNDFKESNDSVSFNYNNVIREYNKFRLYFNLYPIRHIKYYIIVNDMFVEIDGNYIENAIPDSFYYNRCYKSCIIFNLRWIALYNYVIKIQKWFRKQKFNNVLNELKVLPSFSNFIGGIDYNLAKQNFYYMK